jgi:hypothetical protein
MRTSEEKLRPALRKIVSSIASLRDEGYEASAEGLAMILRGESSGETSVLTSPAVGQLPSLSSKKLKNRFHQLVRHGYVRLVYSEEDEDYFLALTEKGEALADPSSLKKKTIVPKAKRLIRPIK